MEESSVNFNSVTTGMEQATANLATVAGFKMCKGRPEVQEETACSADPFVVHKESVKRDTFFDVALVAA